MAIQRLRGHLVLNKKFHWTPICNRTLQCGKLKKYCRLQARGIFLAQESQPYFYSNTDKLQRPANLRVVLKSWSFAISDNNGRLHQRIYIGE